MAEVPEHQRCMNCGATLRGPYCHACGQRDDDYRRPFALLAGELAGDLFAFDSRIFRSVPPFLFAPGMLTRSFIKGKRGKYVSPLRLYFVISIIFFAALAATNVAIIKIKMDADRLEKLAAAVVIDDVEGANLQFKPEGGVDFSLESGEARRKTAAEIKESADKIRKSVVEAAKARKGGAAAEKTAPETPNADRPQADSSVADRSTTAAAEATAPDASAAAEIDQSLSETEKEILKDLKVHGSPVHIAFFSRIDPDEKFEGLPESWKKQAREKIDKSEESESTKSTWRRGLAAVELALENPRAFNQIFNTWIPRLLVIVVPLFALYTSFLYGRKKRLPRRVYYIDHLVFSIYFHSFIFFLMLLVVLKAEWIGNVWDGTATANVFFLGTALYLFVGMKQAFGQGYFKTTIKFIVLYTIYSITLMTALLVVLIWGIMRLPVTT